ncbi:hypothetical protein [Flavobacterium sp.]|uniref:hypothetical protein n=1 Tax=Flavobacterium sp. TaxID=239 RepID=UPI0037A1CF6A
MKRVLSLLVFVLLLNGCNDGNLTVGTIDFSNATTQSCSTTNVIYKLNTQEALILQMPSTDFVNVPTVVGSPTIKTIDNVTYRVIYRSYNGTIASDNICSAIPPSTPTVTDQWTATAGTIQIITTPISVTGTNAGSTVITGYNHNIIFKNITFSRTSGNQVYQTFTFGDYVTPATTLPFAFNQTLTQCGSLTSQIYNYTTGGEALTLDNLDPTLIQRSATTTPRTSLLSATTNKLTYRLYNGLLTSSYFCGTTLPQSPIIIQEWIGATGVTGVSGIVSVTTVKNGSAYIHTITLNNVTLTNSDNTSFNLGTSYIFGTLTN